MPPSRTTVRRAQTGVKQLNVELPVDLFYAAKARAVAERTTLRAAVARILEEGLRVEPKAGRPAPTKPAPGRPRPRPRPKDDDDEDD
jgi:hypothetical protein